MDKNLEIFCSRIPDHDDKVKELGHAHAGHEARGGVVAEHDGNQYKGPNEEPDCKRDPD